MTGMLPVKHPGAPATRAAAAAPLGCRRSTSAAGRTSRPTGAATGRSGCSWCCSCSRCLPSSSPTTGRSSLPTRARSCFPVFRRPIRREVRRLPGPPDYRDPVIQEEINAEKNGWMIWPPIRYSFDTVNNPISRRRHRAPSWMIARGALRRYPQGVPTRPAPRQYQLARHRRPGPRRARVVIYGSASRCCSAWC
jgi:hypothetical protein